MLRSVNELQGYILLATDGEIGKVDDFYFDDKEWTIRYLVVDTGDWLSGRCVLIAPYALGQPNLKAKKLPLALTREQVQKSPEVDSDKPVSRQKEIELHNYYQWPIYWTDLGPPVSPATARGYPEALAILKAAEGNDEEDPHLRSTREVIGYHIQARDGEIGHVEDFILSDESWDIQYMVVDTRNWLPGRKVLVALQWIKQMSWAEQKVHLDLLRETVKNSPEYDPLALVNQASSEEVFYEHYGWPRYYGS